MCACISRNRLLQQQPAIAAAIARLPVADAILDGEMTWDGRAYHVFDVMWLDGRDVTSLPLEQRRALLQALPLQPPLERVDLVEDPQPWQRAASEGWEGVIAKRRDSPYEHRRSPHWLKMKIEETRDFVVGGFTDPQGSRVGLGALLVGHADGADLVFAGKVGTGFDTRLLLDLRARLDALAVPESPFTRAIGLPRGAHWVQPADRRPGRLHRMDDERKTAPPAAAGGALRSRSTPLATADHQRQCGSQRRPECTTGRLTAPEPAARTTGGAGRGAHRCHAAGAAFSAAA